MMLTLNDTHPLNQGVLRHLRDKHGGMEPISTPDSHPDPYMRAGSHPDVVSRIWETLGGALPKDCRAIVYGTPALVHPQNGIVLAMGCGTSYAIRIPDDMVSEAVECGCKIEMIWGGGNRTNVQERFGNGWVFGRWVKKEADWLLASYNNLLGAT